MNLNFLWATLLGGFLGSLADWLFAGLLFHQRYNRHPEVWRPGAGAIRSRIIIAQGLCLVTAGAFVALAVKLGQTDYVGALKLAAMVWLIGPLPLLLANFLFIKIDPLVTASHSAGWLVKLLLCGAAAALLL
ncbi:MAG TPA: hypothetical protein VGX37_06055 [Allosphingosinicella sp.]|jgi:hypothetical protein|nr:hypothetical protein [Allosphingosinicella sp.]